MKLPIIYSLALGTIAVFSSPCPAASQQAKAVTNNDLNDSNNPLNPAVTLNLHNFYVPDLGGPYGRDADVFFIRGLFPVLIADVPNLIRFSMPIVTEPTVGGGHTTGWGDLVVFDVAVFE